MTALAPALDIAEIFANAMAYEAGYDCGRNRANPANCAPQHFATLARIEKWRAGYLKGRELRDAEPKLCPDCSEFELKAGATLCWSCRAEREDELAEDRHEETLT